MSSIDKQALLKIAESVDREEWDVLDNGDDEYQVIVSGSLERGATYRSYRPVANEIPEREIAAFIAAFNPSTLLALLDENIQLQREKDATEAVALALRDDMRQSREKLEAAERRIAEHCKVLNSLAAVARRYLPDYDEHPEIQAADELLDSAAGIGVKQQEDIVDSDVGSRNQPGMVVAVHIGAGDFVKVKGQVFEVEETDFDDHDVTLWFVGGNALKCSAGCPVEVVSAPVAAGIKVKGD
ncbi:ead/Ea22-like family protein [Salmonella enterica subsp. enterica serovar Senftenberg]|uniref:Ead/Ea22-like family protein n=2 Tax=Salmonella enterica TaxID=28901 RepID=A0A739MAF7_SALDE|nr:ead/Ea22-like family protein [Salmonella enterica]EAB5591542.1 ead/Ea22-like family protein [Salmonella enterica subsp. enterica serovar Typhimurium]EBF6607360.1 ead/Ea22-like family protein [Salmonella enterica subsp. enterica serovar Enteritidis]EBY0732106.1 ead/Ea22-like family protein [Salmonella enterica subsp. enterica serovar Livingstone]ECA1370263.1 ead/Ea22-like family protein [Salmonella enterica subsp. enterica serovar Idikan]EDR7036587.1 ead/Ea22-like family protein [Salmonella 